MSATVRKFGEGGSVKRIREVKNLGWLLRHMHSVTALYIHGAYGGQAKLHAYLNIKGVAYSFVSTFADYHVMCEFVSKRRAWKTVSQSRV